MPSKSISRKYKLGPLVAVGIAALVLLNLLILLIWTVGILITGADFSQNTGAPLGIFLLTVFLSCCLMTALIRGGTVFPSALLAALAAIGVLLLTPPGLPFFQVVGRVLLIILVAVLGFVITKLCFQVGRIPSPRPQGSARPSRLRTSAPTSAARSQNRPKANKATVLNEPDQ